MRHVKLQLNVPLNNVLKLMARSKILLHPTLEEPFGISVAEGMSAGLIPLFHSKEVILNLFHRSSILKPKKRP